MLTCNLVEYWYLIFCLGSFRNLATLHQQSSSLFCLSVTMKHFSLPRYDQLAQCCIVVFTLWIKQWCMNNDCYTLLKVHKEVGAFMWCCQFISLYKVRVTIRMKAIEQYFHVVLFIMLYKVVPTLKSLDKTLACDHCDLLRSAITSWCLNDIQDSSKLKIWIKLWKWPLKWTLLNVCVVS